MVTWSAPDPFHLERYRMPCFPQLPPVSASELRIVRFIPQSRRRRVTVAWTVIEMFRHQRELL